VGDEQGSQDVEELGGEDVEELLVDDLLVEEVSIDGMCGVY